MKRMSYLLMGVFVAAGMTASAAESTVQPFQPEPDATYVGRPGSLATAATPVNDEPATSEVTSVQRAEVAVEPAVADAHAPAASAAETEQAETTVTDKTNPVRREAIRRAIALSQAEDAQAEPQSDKHPRTEARSLANAGRAVDAVADQAAEKSAVPVSVAGRAQMIQVAATGVDAADEKNVVVPIGHSTVVRLPWKVTSTSIANPKIADIQVVNPQQVLIVGKAVGSTDLTIWSDDGDTWQASVTVEVDLQNINKDLMRFMEGSNIRLTQSQDVIVVTGTVRRAEQIKAMHAYLDQTGLKYVDMSSVAGVQQVQIQVRVAEASRQAIRTLGINAVHTGEDFFGASTVGGNANGINAGIPEGAAAAGDLPFVFNNATNVGSAVTLFGGFPSIDMQIFLEALADNQYIRVLAEPTLVALSGETASFLAGGEFPVPIVQGSSAGAGTTITVQYKEFGVRLLFEPVVLGDGTIRLRVAPEVSDLSDVGSVTVEGFRIPSLLTRRAETTLEMQSGQTFAMAGLIDRSVTARNQSVPGLGKLPVLGALFRSVRYEQGETELIVLATVELVEPMNRIGSDLPVPGDLHETPSDWELYAEGKLQGKTRMPGNGNAAWFRRYGLDRLKGPGAWEEEKP